MTPNYLRSPKISVSPYCDCSNSGNNKDDCDKFSEFFTENTCLRKSFRPDLSPGISLLSDLSIFHQLCFASFSPNLIFLASLLSYLASLCLSSSPAIPNYHACIVNAPTLARDVSPHGGWTYAFLSTCTRAPESSSAAPAGISFFIRSARATTLINYPSWNINAHSLSHTPLSSQD